MTARDLLLESLDDFCARHGASVTAGLMVLAEESRKSATTFREAYDKIKDDPAARAVQDTTMVTTEGLRMLAEMNTETAKRADAARVAFSDLADDTDDEEI